MGAAELFCRAWQFLAASFALCRRGRKEVNQTRPTASIFSRRWGLFSRRYCCGVTALAISPDGRTLASGGAGGTMKLWSLSSIRELAGVVQVVRDDELKE